MSLNLMFHISDFHNLKIVNNIFFLIFKGDLISLSRGVLFIDAFNFFPFFLFFRGDTVLEIFIYQMLKLVI